MRIGCRAIHIARKSDGTILMRWCLLPLLLLLTVSCEKLTDKCGTVSFEVDDMSYTKADAGVSDSDIRKMTFLLFDTDTGLLLRYANTVGREFVMSEVPYGNLTIYVMANIDDSVLKNVTDISTFKATMVPHYASFMKKSFPMMAKAEFVLTSGEKSVSLTLKRYMSRFRLIKVVNRLNGLMAGEDMILKRAYLTNLQGGFYIDVLRNVPIWYSKCGRVDFLPTDKSYVSAENQVVTGYHSFRDLDNANVAHGTESWLPELEPFYALRNYSSVDRTGWQNGRYSERFTRMVLVAEIKGVEYFYPVNLVNMSPNYSYDVVYVISRLGSDDPDTFDFVDVADKTIDFGDMENEVEVEIEF